MDDSCLICGGLVRHLDTHSFAEVLRFEIRKDLEEVPDEQRPTIVRDIYRNLLGTTTQMRFRLNDTDSLGVYSIDEALGDIAVYRAWRNANSCGLQGCRHA